MSEPSETILPSDRDFSDLESLDRESLALKRLNIHVDRRSELIQEIISTQPSFIEKWALAVFLGIFLVLLTASWFIRYPDIIPVRGVLNAVKGPKEIIVGESGRLEKLFVHNGEAVHRGELLGWIESSADHKDVIELSKRLDSGVVWLNNGQTENVSALFNRNYSDLGEIQPNYQQFIAGWQQFNDYLVDGFYQRKKSGLQNDLGLLETSRQTYESQKQLTQEDIKLAGDSYKMNKALYDEKVLSKEEFREATSKFVNKQMTQQQLNTNLLSNEALRQDKMRDLDQLEHDLSKQKLIFQESLMSLKSFVDDWKRKYLLRSPVDGSVFFIIPLQESRFLDKGKLLGYIVPDDNHYFLETVLAQANFGKVDTGLTVQVRFDAYPYQEAGFVQGKVAYISNIASDSGFLATVSLDEGLLTNNHKTLPYKNGLRADVLIITRNMRLLERLFYNTIKLSTPGNK